MIIHGNMVKDMVCEPETLPRAIPDAENNILEHSIKRRSRRITPNDVEDMAKLISERLSDKEACFQLGIPYASWRNWLSKAKSQPHLDDILARLRGSKVLACMKGIEQAGTRDWRALRERLALLDQRFNDRAQQPATVSDDGLKQLAQLGIDAAKLLLEGATRAKSRAVVEVQTKALPEPDSDKA